MKLGKFKIGRKFATSILGALMVGLNDYLGLGLSEEAQTKIIAILGAWIIGESAIDAASAFGEKKTPKA